LVYRYFGKEVIQNICKSEYEKELDEETLDLVYKRLYKKFIKEIDAIDNGVTQSQDSNYSINTDLSYRIGLLNLPWNAPKGDGYSQHI
jgi:uncharacterized UPF0160 family protein